MISGLAVYRSTNLTRVLSGEDVRGTAVSGAYSESSVDMYRYIIEHTPEDCVIAFRKPRALYLSTQRLSFKPDVNGNESRSKDYYLVFNTEEETALLQQTDETLTVEYENPDLILFRVD